MTDQILAWLVLYGLPVCFVILGVSSFGIPMPVKLLMLVVGALVAQGELEFWQAMLAGSTGAILGDQIGYFLGRFGGRVVIEKITSRFGGVEMLAKAERFQDRWGISSIFFSRWLITPIGPWLNLISGSTSYSWVWFTVVGALGETLWVFLYVLLGIYFADRIQATADFLTSLGWVIFGVFAASILGWKVFQFFRNGNGQPAGAPG